MHGRDVVERHLEDNADAELRDPAPRGREIVDLHDHHVAAVAAAALEEPTGGRVLRDRRDDLEKRVADGHDGVAQAERGDVGIAEGDLDAEDRGAVGDDGIERARDERHLPHARRHDVALHSLA